MKRRAQIAAKAGTLSDPATDAALHALEVQAFALVYELMTVRGAMFSQEARGEKTSPLHVGRFAQAAAALEAVRAPLRGTPGWSL